MRLTKKILLRYVTFIFTLVILFSIRGMFTLCYAASSNKSGTSVSNQTVRTGPGSSYVAAGSISAGEPVYILGTEQGWYHIVYSVSAGKQKSGYVPLSGLTDLYGPAPQEDNFWGGYCYANQSQNVYSCDDYSTAMNIGSISNHEGITRLYQYNSTASSGTTYSVMFIEYSTSSGPKRGYVFNPNFSYPCATCVGRMTASVNLYSGIGYTNRVNDSSGFIQSGSISAGEYVSIIAKNDNYLYIEYNTNSGRKRGFTNSGNVYLYNSPGSFDDIPFWGSSSMIHVYGPYTVYAGPSNAYPIIGYTYTDETMCLAVGTAPVNGFRFVQYLTSDNKTKSGYIYIPNL